MGWSRSLYYLHLSNFEICAVLGIGQRSVSLEFRQEQQVEWCKSNDIWRVTCVQCPGELRSWLCWHLAEWHGTVDRWVWYSLTPVTLDRWVVTLWHCDTASHCSTVHCTLLTCWHASRDNFACITKYKSVL